MTGESSKHIFRADHVGSFVRPARPIEAARSYRAGAMDAVAAIETAIRISPNNLWMHVWLGTLSANYYLAQDYETALEVAKRGLQEAPNNPILLRGLTSALGQLERSGEAAKSLARFLKVSPGFTEETARFSVHFKDAAVFQLYLEGLPKAGSQD